MAEMQPVAGLSARVGGELSASCGFEMYDPRSSKSVLPDQEAYLRRDGGDEGRLQLGVGQGQRAQLPARTCRWVRWRWRWLLIVMLSSAPAFFLFVLLKVWPKVQNLSD